METYVRKIFSKRLSELRIQNNIYKKDLARALNLTSQAIVNYEQGTREPNFSTLVAIADYYNVSIDYLLGRTDKLQ